jgi:hypothetical protein
VGVRPRGSRMGPHSCDHRGVEHSVLRVPPRGEACCCKLRTCGRMGPRFGSHRGAGRVVAQGPISWRGELLWVEDTWQDETSP